MVYQGRLGFVVGMLDGPDRMIAKPETSLACADCQRVPTRRPAAAATFFQYNIAQPRSEACPCPPMLTFSATNMFQCVVVFFFVSFLTHKCTMLPGTVCSLNY